MLKTFELEKGKRSDPKEVIRFLNSSTVDFFNNEFDFKDEEFGMFFKSTLLKGLNDIENTFRGTFYSGLSLSNVDINLFKKMYPRACAILQIYNEKNAMSFGSTLSMIRNLCAHAIPNIEGLSVLNNYCWTYLNYIRPFSTNLKWVNKNELTVAGLILLILLFLRSQSVASLAKISLIYSIVSCGQYRLDDGKMFEERINKVNLELPIRNDEEKSLLGAVAGREIKQLTKLEDKTYCFGVKDYSTTTYFIKIKIDCGHLKVFKNSLTKDYYVNDYDLSIKDLDGFIELSNQFPPFTFIDLLHRLNVHSFDRNQYDIIKDKLNLYSKLNYPKFYSDKNITILLLPETKPDFRIVNNAINSAVVSIFLRLESKIYKKFNIKVEPSDYSTTSKALDMLNIDNELGFKIRSLRNFAFHSYIFEDYASLGNRLVQYNYHNSIEIIRSLERFLKSNAPDFYESFSEDVQNYVASKLMNLKYNQVVEYSIDEFNNHPLYPDPNSKDVMNKFLFIKRSMVLEKDVERLYVEKEPSPLILEYVLSDRDRHLFIKNTERQKEQLNEYIASEGNYIELERVEQGLLTKIYLEKQ